MVVCPNGRTYRPPRVRSCLRIFHIKKSKLVENYRCRSIIHATVVSIILYIAVCARHLDGDGEKKSRIPIDHEIGRPIIIVRQPFRIPVKRFMSRWCCSTAYFGTLRYNNNIVRHLSKLIGSCRHHVFFLLRDNCANFEIYCR